MQKPKFIYFDLGNVLANFSHERGCRQLSAVSGVPWQQIWTVLFDEDLEDRFERGLLSAEQFYDEFCRSTHSRPDVLDFQAAASAIFELNLTVAPIFARLEALGHPLGILSNTNILHWQYCRKHYGSIAAFRGTCALSFEIQSMKPEPRIYDEAAKQCGFAPQDIFFVDDRQENVTGALQCGYDAVLFQSGAQLIRDLYLRGVEFNL